MCCLCFETHDGVVFNFFKFKFKFNLFLFHLEQPPSDNTHQEVHHESVSQGEWFTAPSWNKIDVKQINHSSWIMINLLSHNWIYFYSFLHSIFLLFQIFQNKKEKKVFWLFCFFENFFKGKISSYFWLSSFRQNHLVGNLIFQCYISHFPIFRKKGFLFFFFSKFLSFTIYRQDFYFGWIIFSKNKTAGKIFVFGWKIEILAGKSRTLIQMLFQELLELLMIMSLLQVENIHWIYICQLI